MNELAYRTLLGGYALSFLDADERQAVDHHLRSCPDCAHELTELLAVKRRLDDGGVRLSFVAADTASLEAEGARIDDDLVLQRTLRQARAERSHRRRARTMVIAAASVAIFAAIGTAGVAIGDHVGRPAAAPPSTQVKGRTVTAQDAHTGTRLVATVFADSPSATFSRFDMRLTGEPHGGHCQLIAISVDGTEEVASSWTVPPHGTGPAGTHVTGSVAIPVNRLREIEVRTLGGQHVVGVDLS
jgi:hypothetical protein